MRRRRSHDFSGEQLGAAICSRCGVFRLLARINAFGHRYALVLWSQDAQLHSTIEPACLAPGDNPLPPWAQLA